MLSLFAIQHHPSGVLRSTAARGVVLKHRYRSGGVTFWSAEKGKVFWGGRGTVEV